MAVNTPEPRRLSREDIGFSSHGSTCAAWLYRPEGIARPPVVVMGHGFAAQRDFRLPAFAEAFAGQGFAVLLFDYRGFGASEGQPRQLVSPHRHVQDWQSAIDTARSLPRVDGARMVLWGSSFGGGHALVSAANNPEVKGVIAQVPYVDSLSTLRRLSTAELVQAVWAGLRDLLRSVTGRTPHTVPVFGSPETFACLNTPDSADGYGRMVPSGSVWRNACPARIFLTLPLYRPIVRAARVACPVLLYGAEADTLIPMADLEHCVARLPKGRLERFSGGHFDVYEGDEFRRAVEVYLGFLREHLPVTETGEGGAECADDAPVSSSGDG